VSGEAGDAKPVGREDLRLFLDFDRQPLAVVLPIRIDRLAGRARHVLLFEVSSRSCRPLAQLPKKIDPLKFADAE
jgi:hypothetical protein